jgi:hypothetical protein
MAWQRTGGRVHVAATPKTLEDKIDLWRSIIFEHGHGCRIVCHVEKLRGFIERGGKDGFQFERKAANLFNYGKGYGEFMGAMRMAGVEPEEVASQTWQAFHNLKKGRMETDEWKRYLRDFAQKLFPDVRATLANADALLILDRALRV